MKKLIFLLFIIFISHRLVIAQNWVPSSANWSCYTIDYEFDGGRYPHNLKVTKELDFNGHHCQQIGDDIYVYKSNDTVFFYLNGQFRPSYYYNARVGDTVSYYNTRAFCSPQDSVLKALLLK